MGKEGEAAVSAMRGWSRLLWVLPLVLLPYLGPGVEGARARKVHCYHSWAGGQSIHNFTMMDIHKQEQIPLSR